MDGKDFISRMGALLSLLGGALFTAFLLGAVTLYFYSFPGQLSQVDHGNTPSEGTTAITKENVEVAQIEGGIHQPTGFIADQGYKVVVANCTGCHSSQLVIQNRASREGWKNMITWMQATQNLWDLGDQEEQILNYLAKHYAPVDQGRRKPLANIEWYELK